MKKIFTLLCAAALAVPMMSADEVNVSLYVRDCEKNASGQLDYETISIGTYLGTISNTGSYDEATKVFSLTNLFGYQNANIEFTLDASENFTSKDGQTRTPVLFSLPSGSAVSPNGAKTKWTLCPSDEDYDEFDLETITDLDSGVFLGNEDTDAESLKLVDASLWGVCDETSSTAFENMKKRSFAVPEGGGYKFIIEVQALAIRENYGGGYSFNDYPDFGLNYLAVFTTPGTSTGVSEITVDNEAAVEYFNLQGVRVNNPTNGLYIMRQGSKTTKVSIR